jgi:hypothetical protein
VNQQSSWWLWLCCGVALIVGTAITPTHAQQGKADNSCAYFSPNPDDTAGPPIAFYADLSADEESAVTESPGSGRVDFVLERATLKLTWKATYQKLTSQPMGLHIHGPQTPGGEAGILIDLAPKGMTPLIAGSSVLNEGLLAYLVQDRLYVNLHSAKYPQGELRGPVKKARTQC